MKKQIFLIIFGFISLDFFAQNTVWAKGFGGIFDDISHGITVDARGNVYTTGQFDAGVDFDPGPGTFNMGSTGITDMFISKLNSAGNFKWAKKAGGLFTTGRSIVTDAAGNIYVTGWFQNTGDFDPGPGSYSMTATSTGYDIFILKLDSAGGFLWAKQMGGIGFDQAYSITLDANSNVYTTGYFWDVADFDPGPATYTLDGGGNGDIFVSKLSTSGNFIWARRMGGWGPEGGNGISIDNSGNVYTTGYTQSVDADFDPGPGSYTLASTGSQDIFISKLDSLGNFVWAEHIGGIWDDAGLAITNDAAGNVCLTGYFTGLVDFDPGPLIDTLHTLPNTSFILKLNASGNLVWARGFQGNNYNAYGNAIVVDAFSNVYTTGSYLGYLDFDPGPATYTTPLNGNIYVSKLDAGGNFVSTKCLGGGVTTFGGNGIALDASTNIYATGVFASPLNDFGLGFNNPLGAVGGEDVFVCKLACSPPNQAGFISGPLVLCAGSSATYSINSVSNAWGYSWVTPPGSTISQGANTNKIVMALDTLSGTIVVTPTNACGAGASKSVSVISDPSPVVISQPLSQTLSVGSSTTFIVGSSGQNLSFQWQQSVGSSFGVLTNTGPYSGVNTASLAIGPVSVAQNGAVYRCVITEGNCTATSTLAALTVYDNTGLQESALNNPFNIYPNPVINLAQVNTIAILKDIKYQISDETGRVVQCGNLSATNGTVDLSCLSRGFYFMTIGDQVQRSVKLFKE